jgi:hypothetical protein
VDYVNDYHHTQMRNEVGKLPFLLAIQKYLRQNEAQAIHWVQSHPERRKPDKMEYDLDEWGIYLADCYASNKKPPPQLIEYSHTITAEQVIRNVSQQRHQHPHHGRPEAEIPGSAYEGVLAATRRAGRT